MTDLAMGKGGSFDIGRVIERTFGVVGANFGPLILLALVLSALPQGVVALVAPPTVDGLPNFSGLGLTWAITFISGLLLQASVVHASIVDLNGGKASFADSLRVGVSHLLPVLGISVLMTIALIFGFMLLIVPGVMMAVAWAVAVPTQVVEKTGVIRSFGRSAELTRGSRWSIFALFFIYMLLAFALGIVGAIVFGMLSLVTGGPDGVVSRAILSPALSAVASMIGASGAAAIYYELRSKKEGVAPQELAAVFD